MNAANYPRFSAAGLLAGRYRWAICILLFTATAINYIDRQIIGLLKPGLQHDFGWSESDFGDLVFWFQAAYALGYLGCGRLIDAVGARLGYALVVVVWTLAHAAHAMVSTFGGFVVVRFALGLGESGNFPAGLKAIAEWFPQKERALATGIFTAGSNIGAIITPLIVPFIAIHWGWRGAFVVTASFSIVWLAVWWKTYRSPQDHPQVNTAELTLIRENSTRQDRTPDAPVRWRQLLKTRETWAYALSRFLIDPIWWMFLFWLPDFFSKRHGLDLAHFGPPLVAIYIVSDLGSIAGGWLSSRLLKLGISLNRSRKLTLLIAAIIVTPVMFAVYADNVWIAVTILGLATAGHQAFSVNLYTFPSDVFPQRAVASVVGIGGTAGAIGGMLMSKYAGWVLDAVGTYTPIFVLASVAYLAALAVFHLLSPRMAAVHLVPDSGAA